MAANHKKQIRFSSEEISVFCEQIAMLLNSGIPLYEGIFVLYSEMEDVKTKAVLEKLNDAVRANEPFYQALLETSAFPDYMIHMVKVGETTGKLEEVLRSLAQYYERESNVKASVKSAISYPAVLFGMMSVILMILVFKILPMFESMYLELSADVAASTRNVMNAGMMAGKIVAVLVLIFLAALIGIGIWYQTKDGARRLKNFFVKFGPTKKMFEVMATGQFLSGMALMVSSGIELNQAMEIAQSGASHRKVKERIKVCRQLMEKNIPFDEAIHQSRILGGIESRLVTVAAKTGASDTVLTKLSEQYNEKITSMLNKMSTLIETVLVVVLAVLVGAILVSVMLPLVSMISSIG